jgi:hypothetical protein
MPIRYSSVVGGSGGGTGFNLDVGSSGNTTFAFNEPQPAGGYSITSQLTDATIEFYAIAEDGTLAGYTNSKALSASKDFDTIVVYGASPNDLITFEFKETTLPETSGDQDSGAAPFIASVSNADLGNIDDTTIIAGGNFATDVTVTFTGTDNIVRNAKSVVRTNSTQLIVTRPDDFLEDNSPYTVEVSNPGIPQSAYATTTSSITAGGDPVWTTPSGPLTLAAVGLQYSDTVLATDPEGATVSYSIASGSLPTGVSINASTGEIAGTPSTEGTYNFVVAATDPSGNTTNQSFSIICSATTGGTLSSLPGYIVHTFTEDGSFYSGTSIASLEYLIVGGGGAGGDFFSGGGYNAAGGGGGGGGVLSGTMSVAPGTSYPITIGAGGVSTATSNTSGGYASNGGNTVALGLTAIGGGRGGAGNSSVSANAYPASSGGSGGGGVRPDGGSNFVTGGGNTSGQGNVGGSYQTGTDGNAAGGGGKGSQGANSGTNNSNGGAGYSSSISGVSVIYSAGGGGGKGISGTWTGAGGSNGAGGAGQTRADSGGGGNATTPGSGGGGAGSANSDSSPFKPGGSGSDGIVIVRYAI